MLMIEETVWSERGLIWGLAMLFAHCFYKPKTVLKNKVR